MKLKNTLLASALLSATAFSVNAATELTPEQAAALKPYDRIVVTGRFNAIGDAVKAVSRRADKDGAASFYVVDTSDFGSGGNWRVVADVYKADAEKAEVSKNRVINGVVELPKDQAVLLEPFDTVTVQGFYRSQPEVNDAITKEAREKGAYSFYIVRQVDANQGGNQRITAFIYKADAEKAEASKNRIINGVMELPKDQAVLIEPYDTVTVQGFYRSQPEVNDAITKAAKEKGAYSFYIVRQVDANQGGNQRITAFIYKADAKKRVVQSPDAIPADSDAGRAALAAGGEAAKKVEIPGVATTASPSAEVGRFFETQSTKGGRYTVTLPDGTKVEELNKATAAMMVPFDSIKFTGNYGNMTEISYQVAKRAAKKGAKYYHITRQWSERGNNITISADLYK